MRNTFTTLFLAGTAALLSPIRLHAQAGFGQLNPAAPPETSQYSFIIGKWDCATRFLNPKGEYKEGHAVWTGSYILDGWAIQDLWASEGPKGTFYGLNIRSFNKKTGKWDNRWLPQGTLEWKYFESHLDGDSMVMIGGEGTDSRGPFVDRNTFFDITENSWHWRKDRSWDGGKTWFEGVGFIDATRLE